jgi:prepilin-type N-terminal cleavage/methylation domain-containing protein
MSNKKNNFKLAFTLSEVLITLGIIGVVAAMSIPTLITSVQKIRTATELKKSFAEDHFKRSSAFFVCVLR